MIEMSQRIQKEDKQAGAKDYTKEIQTAMCIIGAATKVGLYAATAVMTYNAILWMEERIAARLAIPGGEILTIPLIVALVMVGWAQLVVEAVTEKAFSEHTAALMKIAEAGADTDPRDKGHTNILAHSFARSQEVFA